MNDTPPPQPGAEPASAQTGTPPPQPQVGNASDDRTFGMLCHLSGLIASAVIGLGFVGPLVIWLWKKDQSAFVDYHGKEALNFNLTVLLAAIVSFVLVFIFIGILLLIAVGIMALVFSILACIAANKGEYYRYPVCIRFIK